MLTVFKFSRRISLQEQRRGGVHTLANDPRSPAPAKFYISRVFLSSHSPERWIEDTSEEQRTLKYHDNGIIYKNNFFSKINNDE